MLFSFESFATLNHWLGAFWRLIALNLLWVAVTLMGLVVIGIGPASYALAKYLDGWVRRGETPPLTATFFRCVREQGWRPVFMGWLLIGAGTVIGVNLLGLTDWYLRVANVVALAVLGLIAAYVFFVMAATSVVGIRRQIVTALLLGVGSLHWSVLGATGVALAYVAMFRLAMPLLFLLGAVLPALLVALILRAAWRDLDRLRSSTSSTPSDGNAVPQNLGAVRTDAHAPARRSEAPAISPSSEPDRANSLQKGVSA